MAGQSQVFTEGKCQEIWQTSPEHMDEEDQIILCDIFNGTYESTKQVTLRLYRGQQMLESDAFIIRRIVEWI